MTAAESPKTATPNPDNRIESVLTDCLNCGQPAVSVKLDAGAEWSDWAHAMTGQVECVIGAQEPPATSRSN